MLRLKTHYFFILLLLIIYSCSTLHKEAQKTLEKGNYEEAMRIYEKILSKTPNDAEAIEGLTKARHGFVDKGLIQVRMMRMGGNMPASIKLLNDILGNQKKWSLELDSSIAHTQDEESQHAFSELMKTISTNIKNDQYIKSQIEIKKFQNISDQFKNNVTFIKALKTVRGGGENKCARHKKFMGNNTFFLNEHVLSYCKHYGKNFNSPTAKKIDKTRYKALNLQIKDSSKRHALNRMPKYHIQFLKESLQNKFKNNIWFYYMGGPIAQIDLSGKYIYSHKKNEIKLAHEYKEKVPYTAYEEYEEIIKEPYTEVVQKQIPNKSFCYSNDPEEKKKCEYKVTETEITKYKTKNVKTIKPVTKYKDETRFYHYDGLKQDEDLTLELYGIGKVDIYPVHIPFKNSEKNSFISHNQNMPDIGLKPQKETMIDIKNWLTNNINSFAQSFAKKLDSLWNEKYCNMLINAKSEKELGELVERCGRVSPLNDLVNKWYQKHYGVSYSEYNSYLHSNK